jgi:hypothetical protein
MSRQVLRRLVARLSALLLVPVLCGGTGQTNNFAERALAAHNRERALAGVAPMVWDEGLKASAQAWADHLAATGGFEHASLRQLGDEGENLWAGSRGYYSVDAMVDAWAREKQYFRPAVFPGNSVTGDIEDVGHYTQLIWRRTKHVGCAMASGPVEDVFVCRYNEAGNWEGQSPL